MLLLPSVFPAFFSLALAAQEPASGEPLADDVGSSIAELVALRMREDHLPGAAVAVVEDGRLVFTGGYGVASLETGAEVSAETTLFRIGSISKVFSALALTQQAERGKIRLDDEIAPHLGELAIAGRYASQLRFWHLMTHTAGFDQIGLDRHAASPADQLSPRQFLEGRLIVVRPPGRFACYDTYAITLAGHLVERLSGKPYGRYLREEIFEPLGMTRTFLQAPDESRAALAKGYGFEDGAYVPQPYEYYNTLPASSVDSTARDMGLLLVALLGDGSNEHGRMLAAKTLEEVHAPQFRNDPELPGFTHGFWEEHRNGVRALQHGGTMFGFSAQLTFFPGRGVGVFSICNRDSETGPAPQLHELLVRKLADRWFPEPASEKPVSFLEKTDVARFAGLYTDNLYCHTCDEGTGWDWSPFAVKAAGENELDFWGTRWTATSTTTFVERLGGRRAVFRVDDRGRVTHLCIGHMTCERLGEPLLEEAVGAEWRDRKGVPLVARVLRALERWAEAAQAYEAIATSRPDDGRAQFHAGLCWSHAGEARRAAPRLERAIELGAWPELAAFHAGAGFAAAGEAELAFEWLARALDLGFADVALLDDPRWRSLRDDPRFEDLAAATRDARAHREVRDLPVPADSIPRWVGRYQADAGMQVEVLEREGSLVVALPGRAPIRLLYQGGEEFRSEANALLRFVFASEGAKASRFTFYDDDGSAYDLRRID